VGETPAEDPRGGTVRAVSEEAAAIEAPEASRTPSSRDVGRARRARVGVVAVLVLVAVVVLLGLVVWGARDSGHPREGAADELLAAYARHLDATFLVEGETTRTMADGRTLSSAYLTVQRPPDRLHRALGSTSGELGGRTVNCATAPDGAYSCAASGEAEPWDRQRAGILATLDGYVRGPDPVYAVNVDDTGCFVLVRRRTEIDATFGRGARLCFDQRYGALRRLEVQREGGATDVMLADRITDQVSDTDFSVGEDATYDPEAPAATGTDPTSSTEEQP